MVIEFIAICILVIASYLLGRSIEKAKTIHTLYKIQKQILILSNRDS